MLDWQINGLPLHPLIVHFVVIAIPLASLMVVVGAVWPVARRKFGILTPLLGLGALASVPLATQAGEALEEKVGGSAVLERHTQLGDMMLPWAIGLFAIAAIQWVWFRFFGGTDARAIGTSTSRAVIGAIIGVAGVTAAVGSIVMVVAIGDSGAMSVWLG